jgi:hypothetical protein
MEYVLRLCEVITLTSLLFLSKKKLTFIFNGILKVTYYECLIENSVTNFMDVAYTTEKVKQGLKLKKIKDPTIKFGAILKDELKK